MDTSLAPSPEAIKLALTQAIKKGKPDITSFLNQYAPADVEIESPEPASSPLVSDLPVKAPKASLSNSHFLQENTSDYREKIQENRGNPITLQKLKDAVEKAQCAYEKHYHDSKQDIRTKANGWFSWARHGKQGQINAKNFKDNITNQDNMAQVLEAIDNKLRSKDTRFHRHSFASYLMDALCKLSPQKAKDKYTVEDWEALQNSFESEAKSNYDTVNVMK